MSKPLQVAERKPMVDEELRQVVLGVRQFYQNFGDALAVARARLSASPHTPELEVAVIRDVLLPIVDNLEQVCRYYNKRSTREHPSLRAIMNYLVEEARTAFCRILGSLTVRQFIVTGRHFDPLRHETQSPMDNESGAVYIIDKVNRNGYNMGSEVLRKTQVSVISVREDSEQAPREGTGA